MSCMASYHMIYVMRVFFNVVACKQGGCGCRFQSGCHKGKSVVFRGYIFMKIWILYRFSDVCAGGGVCSGHIFQHHDTFVYGYRVMCLILSRSYWMWCMGERMGPGGRSRCHLKACESVLRLCIVCYQYYGVCWVQGSHGGGDRFQNSCQVKGWRDIPL